jgi:hypothetical protein
LLSQKSWQHAGITSAYAWSQRILHVQSIDCQSNSQSNVISCPKQRHFMSKATAKATSFHVHPRKAKTSTACLAPYRQLQWRKGTSRQCQRRMTSAFLSMTSALLSASHVGGTAVLSATANGGINFPPVHVVGSTFRHCLWRK